MKTTDREWWGELKETFEDRPRGWRFVYDDGAGVCRLAGMPKD